MGKKNKWLILAVVIVCCCIPLVLSNEYYVEIFIQICIFTIVALGLNVITGYTGQLSIGHAAFCAIGAYLSGWLSITFHVPFLVAFLVSSLATGLFGLLVGVGVLVAKGPYLAMITVGLGEIIRLVIVNIPAITGGPMGMTGIPDPTILSFSFATTRVKAYLVMAVIFLVIYFIRRLMSSKMGRAFLAIRENEDAAAAMGIDTHLYKALSFGISTMIAGMGGSLYAHVYTVLSPEVFITDLSVQFLAMIVLGGMGTIIGPIMGAVLLVLAPELLRPLADYQMLIYGIMLMLCMSFLPYGLMSFIETSYAKFKLKRKSHDLT